ncbi:hypothetical protein M9H77_11686 [Catharanthus roseus]|uniref:Uncharacterized protein n=1 Tax=Catharanthus roseus TaxID=4058 RepID=A0ACC0BFF7_CATRO|nr:hypothetical protein M9H77_11686 [Catharanthus roseus]
MYEVTQNVDLSSKVDALSKKFDQLLALNTLLTNFPNMQSNALAKLTEMQQLLHKDEEAAKRGSCASGKRKEQPPLDKERSCTKKKIKQKKKTERELSCSVQKSRQPLKLEEAAAQQLRKITTSRIRKNSSSRSNFQQKIPAAENFQQAEAAEFQLQSKEKRNV